eukprot:Tbor_TRINITY_DN6145_c0_g5::TRINITY_DN6145_c0_g5_i1::g.21729::m.21729
MRSFMLRDYRTASTAFLCCDLQERFEQLMNQSKFNQCVSVASRFAEASKVIPNTSFVTTEQYPERLGKTVSRIPIPKGSPIHAKTKFSMFDAIKNDIECSSVCVIFGIEAHVCVLQTVAELLEHTDKEVVIAIDGIASTNSIDQRAAEMYFKHIQDRPGFSNRLKLLSSESVLFQLVQDSKDPVFKNMSQILKNYPIKETKM